MAHTPDMTAVSLRYLGSNKMGTSCRFTDDKEMTEGTNSIWIATSQIDYGDFDPDKYESGTTVDVEIPVWLAMKEGLI